jgi:predicted dehydrogenase
MKSQAIRVGIIGVGRIAVDAHIPDLRKAGAEVFALADVAPGRFASQFGMPHAFDDYREMLKRDDLDAVVVASPTPDGALSDVVCQVAHRDAG